jgi:hypothetical protein
MNLPHGDRAVVDMRKLRGYCLSESHPRGRHKARVFAAALGVGEGNADLLRDALLNAAKVREAIPGRSNEFGERYFIDFEMRGPRGEATVRSLWIIRLGESFPRLTSCFVM